MPNVFTSSLYPFQSRYFQHKNYRQHYLDEGEGHPIVLVHGNPSWSFMYRNLILELRKSFRVIAPDHIGCGLSDKPSETIYEYTLDQRAADLNALLEHLGVKQNMSLVVHDWGGPISFLSALQYGFRPKRIAVTNSAAFLFPQDISFPFLLTICRIPYLSALWVQGFNAFMHGALLIGVSKWVPWNVRSAWLAPYDSWSKRLSILRFIQDIPFAPGDRAYASLAKLDANSNYFKDIPMSLCWGPKDIVFNERFLQEWQRRFPQAKVCNIEHANHYVIEDAPEIAIPFIRDFFLTAGN